MPVTKQYYLVLAYGRLCSLTWKVIAGLVESNGSLPPGGWLKVICGLTDCRPGSAPGSGIDRLTFTHQVRRCRAMKGLVDCYRELVLDFLTQWKPLVLRLLRSDDNPDIDVCLYRTSYMCCCTPTAAGICSFASITCSANACEISAVLQTRGSGKRLEDSNLRVRSCCTLLSLSYRTQMIFNAQCCCKIYCILRLWSNLLLMPR